MHGASVSKDHPLTFTHVSSRARIARIEIAYTNSGDATVFAELRVNGQTATRIAFPPTGSDNSAGVIWIQSLLDRSGPDNVLSFSAPCDPGPNIESISLE
jgi:hypothetical protein